MGKRNNDRNKNGSVPSRNNYQDKFANSERNKGLSRDEVNKSNEENFDRYYNKNRTGNQDRGGSKKQSFGFSNDWTWYAKDAQQVKDFASISFNTTLGYPINMPGVQWSETTQYAAPGIMGLYMIPTPGISSDQYSAINVAADQMLQFIRSKVSGERGYDSANLMMYIMAMDSQFSYYAYLKRIYGVMNNYETVNRYLPRILCNAMGVSYDDIKRHMSDFRGYINQYANTLKTWAVPNTMSLITKHVWMYSNVYKDADNEYGQIYLYNPAGFYYYDQAPLELDPPQPAQLNIRMLPYFASPGRQLATVDDLINFGEEMYQEFAAGGWAQIKADILNAYGGNIFTIAGIDETELCTPVYNEEVLSQINNTRIWDGLGDVSVYKALKWQIQEVVPKVANKSPYLIFQPRLSRVPSLEAQAGRESWIINFHKRSPQPEDIIVASRNMFLVENPSSATSYPLITSCGSEVCVGSYIYTLSQDQGSPINPLNSNYYNYHTDMTFDYSGTVNDVWADLRVLGMSTCFDWHPLGYLVGYDSTSEGSSDSGIIYPFGDLNTYTVVQGKDIKNMNDVAIRSLFGVPMQI